MTRKRFEEMFKELEADSFEFEGKTVHGVFRREISPGTLIDIEFLQARENPPQGIDLQAGGGRLAWEAYGIETEHVAVWADDRPTVTLRYVNPRKTSELCVWNVWLERVEGRSWSPGLVESDLVQAWWAWSGMLIEEEGDDQVLLRCSGSYDGPDFGDLVVRLTFRSAHQPGRARR